MLTPLSIVFDRGCRRLFHGGLLTLVVLAFSLLATADARGQVMVYQPAQPVVSYYAPMAAGYPGGYVANYSPAGNYAAVTAFSPPVAPNYVANYPVTQVANYAAVEPVVAAAPVSVTSYYAPAPVYATPVTSYYAPAAVAVPLYRRGPFGGLRPVRYGYGGFIPY